MRLGDFEVYRELLVQETGVDIDPNKTYLLESRLSPIVRKWGYPTIESMTLALRGVPEPQLVHDVVQAMASNDTKFFRDADNFEALEFVVIPYLIKHRKKKREIRMWSAGCSTGQEVWSMQIAALRAMEAHKANKKWNLEMLATDISDESLAYAERAIYNPHEAQSETLIRQLIEYFEQSRLGWNVKDELKNRVTFQTSNLLHETGSFGTFDVIFCCNVMNEFNRDAREKVLGLLADQMADDGFLFLGGEDNFEDETGLFMTLPGYPKMLLLADGDYKLPDLNPESLKAKE